MIKRILMFIIASCFVINLSHANDLREERNDDTCIPQYGFDRIINILATVGIYYWFSHDFKMVDPAAETLSYTDGDGNYIQGTCSQPIPSDPQTGKATGGVKYVYQPSFFGAFDVGTGYGGTLKDGDQVNNGAIYLRAKQIGDALCIQWAMTLGYRTVGCKYVEAPKAPASNINACFINQDLCGSRVLSESSNLLPITAPLVQCVIDAVSVFLLGHTLQQTEAPEGCSTVLNRFQNNLRTTVKLLLVLYMVFFGMKIILSPQPPQKAEIFMFIIKMVLVTYFSVGFSFGEYSTNTDQSTGVMWIFSSAMKSILQLIEISAYSGTSATLCKFESTYSAGYEYLRVFDFLDCRILYYLGLNSIIASGQFVMGTVLTLLAVLFNPVFLMILLLVLVYAFLFISVIIHVVHAFVISIIVLTILIFLAPIFVPMALFQTTKQMFEGWFSNVLGNILQPTILMAFCAFMFNIMDNVAYPGCKYTVNATATANSAQILSQLTGTTIPSNRTTVWQVEPGNDPEACKNSFGYLMQQMQSFGQAGSMSVGEFFNRCANSLGSLLTLILFMFLFYFFVDMLDSVAADLSGAPSNTGMGLPISPNMLAKMAINSAGAQFTKGATQFANKVKKARSKGSGDSGGGKSG